MAKERVLKDKPCPKCGTLVKTWRIKMCEPCRKKARVKDTQRWVQRVDNNALENIDPKYLHRNWDAR